MISPKTMAQQNIFKKLVTLEQGIIIENFKITWPVYHKNLCWCYGLESPQEGISKDYPKTFFWLKWKLKNHSISCFWKQNLFSMPRKMSSLSIQAHFVSIPFWNFVECLADDLGLLAECSNCVMWTVLGRSKCIMKNSCKEK